MRFWTSPPEPGSLEEVIATAVEMYEEYRQFEYMSAGILGSMYAAARTDKSQEAVSKILKGLENKYFGKPEGTSKIDDKERSDFESLMENTFAKIHGPKLREAAAMTGHPRATTGQPIVYTKNPRGKLLD